jgi:ArsR family transcriptional regulator
MYLEESSVDPGLVEGCCEPLLAGALSNAEAEDLASVFKVLADPARLRLLSMIAGAGESCACDLVEPVGRSQPTVSHHLAALTEAGLLTREKRGRWAWYQIVPERFVALQRALQPRAASPIDSVGGNSPVTM